METLLKSWNVMRIVRLVVGSLIGYSAITEHQPLLGLMAGLLVLQSVLNVGCGAAGCGLPRQTRHPTKINTDDSADEIIHEKIH